MFQKLEPRKLHAKSGPKYEACSESNKERQYALGPANAPSKSLHGTKTENCTLVGAKIKNRSVEKIKILLKIL
jgi:hypothetical protein